MAITKNDFNTRNHLFFSIVGGKRLLNGLIINARFSPQSAVFVFFHRSYYFPRHLLQQPSFLSPLKIFGAKYFQNFASFSNGKNILDKRIGLAKLHPPGRQLQTLPPSRNPLASCQPAVIRSEETVFIADQR